MRIQTIDTSLRAELAEHIRIERCFGSPRFDLEGLVAWFDGDPQAIVLRAIDDDGESLGCATASIVPELADSVQVNAFAGPGDTATFAALIRQVAVWANKNSANTMIAHVSKPQDGEIDNWLSVGFTLQSSRYRVERPVVAEDQAIIVAPPPGIRIVPLRDFPDHVAATIEVWNACHDDIPSILPFEHATAETWVDQINMDGSDQIPESLFIAIDAADNVVGVALLIVHYNEGKVGGHRITGVLSSARGQGLGAALKQQMILWAAQNNIPRLRGSNDVDNAAMRRINSQLGYREKYRIDILTADVSTTISTL